MSNETQSELKLIPTSSFERVDFTWIFENEIVKKDLEPWVYSSIHIFDFEIPVPPTIRNFKQGSYFRIKNHNRSFCYTPLPDNSQSVICIKGCEIFSPDFEENLKKLEESGHSQTGLNLFVHFVTIENKIPACLTYTEALGEAKIAADVQEKYIRTYNEIAPMPLPISVFKMSEDVCLRIGDKYQSAASNEYYNDLTRILKPNGLGIYVYLYPVCPIRVKNLNNDLPLEHPRDRKMTLCKIISEPENVIYDWITLFARLLCIGFLPATSRAIFTGIVCDHNNAAIGGGFCDVGSIEKMSDIKSDRIKLEGIQISFDCLCESILQFVSGQHSRNGRSKHPLNFLKLWIYNRLCEDVDINKHEIKLDPVITSFFNNKKDMKDMLEQFYCYF